MLMTDDTGWGDFGAYPGGGKALGHPTPNIDRVAKEGGHLPVGMVSLAALRVVPRLSPDAFRSVRHSPLSVAPGDENGLKKETPTIAEFFKKNGYQTYFSGKWHLGDKPEFIRSSTASMR